jgi:hypothetical protein
MPLMHAFPLGLVLFGTTNLVLADGSTISRLTAYGSVTVASETDHGVIVLDSGSTEVLIGMEFLRTFKKALILFPDMKLVAFIDEAAAKAAILAQAQAVQAAATPTQPTPLPSPPLEDHPPAAGPPQPKSN